MNLTEVFSIETALRGLAVFTGGFVVVLLMRRASAAARHHALLCTMVAAIAIPLAAAVVPRWRVVPHWRATPQLVNPSSDPVYSTSSEEDQVSSEKSSPVALKHVVDPKVSSTSRAPRPSAPLPWKKLFVMIWLCGTGCMLLFPLAGVFLLRRLEKRAVRCDSGFLHEAVVALARETGLRCGVEVWISRNNTMPMVWGIFRHCLLLPASAAGWPESRLRIVLLHELAHLRRNDPAALLVARVALAFHWFNPLAWAAHHQLRADQELSCDDRVLSHGITAPDYADEMLGFSADLPRTASLLPAPMMVRGSGLERRIRGILDDRLDRRPLSSRGAGNITLLATLLALPLAILGAADLIVKPAVRGRILDRNGVVLVETEAGTGVRIHPFNALGVHLLGVSNPKADGKGTAGVEESFEEQLKSGKDITLTLDARIQSVVESTLRESGIGRGAVVILDPGNGDVLASASFPSFDPGSFTEIPYSEKLRDSPTQPFLNRTINAFTPGSVFSIIPSLASGRSSHANAKHHCEPVKFGNHSINCWIYNKSRDTHGDLDLRGALANSCGSYFCQLGGDLGFDEMSATAALLGVGRKTGIPLARESTGTYGPRNTPAGGKVSGVEAAFLSIGQGSAEASPLQIASMSATVANGGRVFTPRIELSAAVAMTADLREHGIGEDCIRDVQRGMTDRVLVFRLMSEKVTMAGVTGTAQTAFRGQRTHNAWFTGYAPAEAPRFAIAVMVQNAGSGGGVAGPIARRILEVITGELPDPAAQAPADGHMRRLETEDMKL